jgi:ribosomal-protein-alanine N-acetyltransferase
MSLLIGNNISIRFLEESDAGPLHDLHEKNRDFFQNYTPSRNHEFYTIEYQGKQIRASIEDREQDRRYDFGVFLNENEQLIGKVTLSEILRGPLQSCFIGYNLDNSHNGKGYMTEAVRLTVTFAFECLKLHRLEASVMPHNIGSIKVLEKAGFHKEGVAQKSVKINGKWEDHQVLAIINHNNFE